MNALVCIGISRPRPFAPLVWLVFDSVFPFRNQDAIRSSAALTPQSSAQDLRIKPLLVFADLRRVVLWPCVDRIDVDHRTLTGRVLTQSLLQPSVITVTWGTSHAHIMMTVELSVSAFTHTVFKSVFLTGKNRETFKRICVELRKWSQYIKHSTTNTCMLYKYFE